MSRALALFALVLAVCATTPDAVARPVQAPTPAPTVAIVPIDPAADVDAAVRAASVRYNPVVVVLPAVDDGPALAATEAGLARAHAAWLAQRYDDMRGELDRIEVAALPVLARPEHADALWQLAFLRGLAAVSRGGAGAEVEAQRWFGLALELDAARRPSPGTYPPTVDEAFALAAEDAGRRVARAIAVRAVPADAVVVVDRVPLIERARPRLLRRGLHVVLVEAPGYAPAARLIDVDTAAIDVVLDPIAGVAPAAALAPLVARGLLDVDGPTAAGWIHAAVAASGAELGLVVGAHDVRLVRNMVIEPARPDATTALAPLLPPPPPPPARSRRRWLLWGGVGVAVVAAGVAAALLLRDEPVDHTRIGF